MKSFEEAVASVNARYEAFNGERDTNDPLSSEEVAPLFAGTLLQVEDVAKLCTATVSDLMGNLVEQAVEMGKPLGPERVQATFYGALVTVLLVGYELGSSAERDIMARD